MSHQDEFTTLIKPYLPALYRQAKQLCANTVDAEDLFHDVMLKLYPLLDEMQAVENLKPWLARVLYRQFVDLKRRQARSPLHLVVDNHSEDEDKRLNKLASPDPGPEQALIHTREQSQLLAALAQLNDAQQLVLSLHDVEGYTLPEISVIIDCPLGTLKSRLHRARERLRQLLYPGNGNRPE